jgi:hypothetical protein
MKRLILAGFIVALAVSGLCLAGIWSGQGTAMTYSDDDPNGDAGPERLMGISIQPVWLADDPNEPDEPIDE